MNIEKEILHTNENNNLSKKIINEANVNSNIIETNVLNDKKDNFKQEYDRRNYNVFNINKPSKSFVINKRESNKFKKEVINNNEESKDDIHNINYFNKTSYIDFNNSTNFNKVADLHKIQKIIKNINTKKAIKHQKEDLLIYCLTFNMKGKVPSQKDIKLLLPKFKTYNMKTAKNSSLSDSYNDNKNYNEYNMYIINTQECMTTIFKSFFSDKQQDWIDMIKNELGNNFVEIKSEKLNAIYITLMIEKSLAKHISNIESSTIKNGFGNMLSNKGAAAISFKYFNYSILFINCHLAAGQKSFLKRNEDFKRINNNLCFNILNDLKKTTSNYLLSSHTISDYYDICIFSGDMNYRIDLPLSEAYNYLINNRLEKIIDHDQLYKQIDKGYIEINHFNEGRINFYPSYKFEPNSDNYDIEAKQPGWTDRILYKSKLNSQFSLIKYNWIRGVKFSDHKPVVAEFIFNLKQENEESNLLRQSELKDTNNKSNACVIF